MEKFDSKTEKCKSRCTTSIVEGLFVNLCFTRLKELKLTNTIDEKLQKDKINNNETQRKDRTPPLECFEEEQQFG